MSWDEVCEEAFGECDLLPKEFYKMTLREYLLRRRGIRKYRRTQLQQEYQHVRLLAYHSMLPYMAKKDRRRKLDDIIPDIYDEHKKISGDNLKDHYKKIKEQYKAAGLLN